jgi:UDP-N-acetylglucosamine transferase subunit ALG13
LIFVTVGTHIHPFNRLLEIVDALPTNQERIVQYGFSTIPLKNCETHRFLEFERMRRFMSRADAVVSHAGVGSIMLALAACKRPVVAPRLHRFGEHVDDHQVEIAQAFAAVGKVITLMPGDDFALKIAESGNQQANPIEPSQGLIDFLREAITHPHAGRKKFFIGSMEP